MPPNTIRLATDEELLRCHPQEHIDRIADCFHKVDPGEMELKKVKLQQNKYQYRLDEDTYDGLHSNLAHWLAAGSIMAVTEAVLSDKENVKSGFAVVRPPGHHCESKTPQGFCLFNSVAVAARHAQAFAPKRCKKVLIVDWDVHHGNGTKIYFTTIALSFMLVSTDPMVEILPRHWICERNWRQKETLSWYQFEHPMAMPWIRRQGICCCV